MGRVTCDVGDATPFVLRSRDRYVCTVNQDAGAASPCVHRNAVVGGALLVRRPSHQLPAQLGIICALLLEPVVAGEHKRLLR
eukprot:scaffold15396_cov22-Tisochrysis_lutea.AAC.2